MNERDQAELAQLKLRHYQISRELQAIAGDLDKLERRLQAETETSKGSPPAPPVLQAIKSPEKPPPLPRLPQSEREPSREPASTKLEEWPSAEQSTQLSLPQDAPASLAPEAKPETKSLELRLGTFWAPRIGIVVLLTGLVFIGNLAYQSLNPMGKVLLLYLASGILLGAGWWWQRRAAKETLRNYAQVLFAGGLAALYFTTYAAYHFPTLQVLQSAWLDGVLLLGCASFIVWTADRWKSQVLALFGAGLAYYTCIITRVGFFTLYSNLLLTVCAVFFLVRNRWAGLTFGSVVATYGAYAFWRFFNGMEWHWSSPAEGLWSGSYFLVCYWIVFTAAVFLSRDTQFAGQNRAAFLTLNNGAFFTCALLTLLQVGQSQVFWVFALVYGAVLIVLSEFAWRLLDKEPLARDFYLSQGLLLATIGFISKFAGLNLSLILASQSVILLLLGQARKNLVLVTFAYLTAGLSVAWAIDGLRLNQPSGIYLGIGIGGLMLANTVLVHRRSAAGEVPLLRPDRSYFAILALVTWFVVTYDNTSSQHFPLVLAVQGLVLTFSIYLLAVREIALLSQGVILIGQLAWIVFWCQKPPTAAWWNPALLLGTSLALSHWWQHQQTIKLPVFLRLAWQEVYALALVGVLGFWLSRDSDGPAWLALSSGLAVLLTAYGVMTRGWLLAANAQLFAGISVAQFVYQLLSGKPGWIYPLAPIAALVLLSLSTVAWFQRRPDSNTAVRVRLLQIALGYRWVAIALSMSWIGLYIHTSEQVWVQGAVGLALFFWAGWGRNREALAASFVYAATAMLLFWVPAPERLFVYWPNFCFVLLLLAQQQVARRLPARFPLASWVHPLMIVAGSVSLWRFSNAWVLRDASGFYLTASWSFLALIFFACGILLRERVFRWIGLGLLACALGRIVIFDVWKLQTLYRILSFMALGIVLLVLGYIYSRYQEKIKEWL